MHTRLLRVFLGFSAVAWGASVFGIFLSWSSATEALQGLGARPIAFDRMLDYWLRMAAGAFTLVGGLYFLLLLRPQKYLVIIPWFGGLMICEGCILLVHGVRLALPPLPFYADTAACFFGGAGILWFARKVQKDGAGRNDEPDGPANGSQPICSETNSTSSAAGSRR